MNLHSVIRSTSLIGFLTNVVISTSVQLDSASSEGQEPAASSEKLAGAVKKEEHPECLSPPSHTFLGFPFGGYVSNCTCECPEELVGWYKNDTPCIALGLGYNNENTTKHGKCYNGECVLDNITLGCKGPRYERLREPKEDNIPEVGCAFLCKALMPDNKTYVLEFDYFEENTSCRHVTNAGSYEDTPIAGWFNATYVNGTCKKRDNKTLCIAPDTDVPVC